MKIYMPDSACSLIFYFDVLRLPFLKKKSTRLQSSSADFSTKDTSCMDCCPPQASRRPGSGWPAGDVRLAAAGGQRRGERWRPAGGCWPRANQSGFPRSPQSLETNFTVHLKERSKNRFPNSARWWRSHICGRTCI